MTSINDIFPAYLPTGDNPAGGQKGASVGSWKDTRIGVCLPQPMTAGRDLNPQGAKAPVLTSLLATSIMYP